MTIDQPHDGQPLAATVAAADAGTPPAGTAAPPDTGAGQVAAVVWYHRLSAHVSWRRTLAATIVIFTVWIGLRAVLEFAAAQLPGGQLPVLGPASGFAARLFGVAVCTPLVLAAAWGIERRPAGTVSSIAGRLRWSRLGWWLLVATGFQFLFVGVVVCTLLVYGLVVPSAVPTSPSGAAPQTFGGEPGRDVLIGGLIIVALLAAQTIAEEYQRGWLLQAVRVTRSPWQAIFAQVAVWALLHADYSVHGAVALVLVGVMLGWVTVHSGGLEAAIAWHLVTNISGGVLWLLHSGLAAFGPDIGVADVDSWLWLPAMLVTVVGYAATVARKTARDTTTPGPAAPG
ncbi:CPBP family intramembrane glutamic endopeptidase [Catenuloplanes atrovinosus]|uniref:Membrane protease YdiL (CAAX protease family) n=1 Tax=Catenuloplanes atrovinosus TaxID=137266 RepID=A0AAE3YSS1_9ACTN|nr:CPBP family intramembrane glutamic endopeptidase [Catenuloplanes atrovinosus]MDR7277704.1 membrane protease YdiL (CAAX protease family) [Catenuloplanes atrovinosus]